METKNTLTSIQKKVKNCMQTQDNPNEKFELPLVKKMRGKINLNDLIQYRLNKYT